MTIEAPISKFKKSNLKIYAATCIIFAIVFAYDGYLSKYQWSHRRSFYDEHTEQGHPDDTMLFNQKAPIFLGIAAVFLIARLQVLKNKRLLAGEDALIISNNEKIPYDSIQKIDKTHFDSKGFFIITYKGKNDNETKLKLSDRTYGNLAAVLDELVAKIS